MQHTLTSPPSGSVDLEVNPSLNVVIAYEDFDAGKHAKKTYDYLVEHLGHEFQFTNQMWKFEVLNIPKLREIAVRDALAADIIVVSSRGGELSFPVQAWIEGWLAEMGNALALVALFVCAREEAGQLRSLRARLADVARRGKMEFFAQPDDWPGLSRSEQTGWESHSGPDERTLQALASVVQRDVVVPRWGFGE
jgi:hypothetical protein